MTGPAGRRPCSRPPRAWSTTRFTAPPPARRRRRAAARARRRKLEASGAEPPGRSRRADPSQTTAPIVPAGSVTGRSLTLVITIMCFLACLTAGAVYMMNQSASPGCATSPAR